MRKNVKKLAAATLAATMALSMGSVIAFAEDYTLTINDSAVYPNTGRVYYAYKLMDVSIGGSGESAVYTYTINSDFSSVIKEALGLSSTASDDDVLSKIASYSNDSAEMKAFANSISVSIDKSKATEFSASTGVSLEQGYYLIIPSDFSSRGIVQTVKLTENTKINIKGSVPTFDKEVYHDDTLTWGDVADNEIGENVQYRFVVNIPDDAGDYKDTYVLRIHDVLESTLSFNNDLKYAVGDGEATVVDSAWISTANTDSCTFEVTIPASEVKANAGKTLYFTYSCELLTTADIAPDNNENTAHMEYSGSPYVDWDINGDGDVDDDDKNGEDTEDTQDVTVYDYTFKFDGIKVNSDRDPLADAQFTLSGPGGEIKFTYDDVNDRYIVSPTGTVSTITTTSTGKIEIVGLDDATEYILTETKAPDGYKAIAPLKFTISADSNYSADGSSLSSYLVSEAVENANVEIGADNTATITDTSSAELPSTGGIGTTIFYIVGLTLMAGAAVVLVARKKASEE